MTRKIEIHSLSELGLTDKKIYQMALQITENEVSFISISEIQYKQFLHFFKNFVDKQETTELPYGKKLIKTYFSSSSNY
jgi:hypothetical protein